VLIDIWRYGKTQRRLGDLTSKLGEAAILVPWITQAEFSRGALFKNVSLERLAEFYKSFHLVPLDQANGCLLLIVGGNGAGRSYSGLSRFVDLLRRGQENSLLTRNPKHLERPHW
jgi:hypothetical protein